MKHAQRTAVVLALSLAVVVSLAGTAYAEGEVRVAPGAAPASAFPPPTTCQCHGERLKEWGGSMHSNAITDPLFRAKVAEGDAATGGKMSPFCLTCHAPVATMAGEIGGTMSPAGGQAVGCMFCHQIVGTAEPLGNVSQLLVPDGTRRAQLEQPQAPHPALYSEFSTKSELCGGCHNVMHPGNGMHLESSYKEWAESPQAKAGVQCQDCHMSKEPGAVGPFEGTAAAGGPVRPNIYRMSFVGAQVGQASDPALPTALLKSAAKVKIEAPEVAEPGKETSVSVTITNVGAGHYLPTGLTEVREMWLEVSLVAADGTVTKLGEHKFGTVLQDDKGNHPVELWDATGVFSDDRIPPQGSVTDGYSFKLPTAESTGKLKAELKYRSAPEELATKAGVDNPTTIMASAVAPVFGSTEAQTKAQAAEESSSGGAVNPAILLGVAAAAALVAIVAVFVVRSRAKKA